MKLHVGAGKEIITPKIGGNLMGYSQDIYSESVNDDLTVTVIAFEQEETRALLFSVSVCLISDELSDEIRTAVETKTGVPAENILLCCTHTHSGPVTVKMTGWGDVDRPYCDEILIPRCVAAAVQAVKTLKPVQAGIGTAQSRVGVNRREVKRDGRIELGVNPWGLRDPVMTVITFRCEDGSTLANIVHYGAHCTASGANREITRDWAGVMTDRLEAESGGITAFINGALGDVGPRLSNGLTWGKLEYAMETGAMAALDATYIYRYISHFSDVDCSVATGEIRIPYEPLLPLDQAEKEFNKYDEEPPHNLDHAKYNTLKEIIAMHGREQTGKKSLVLDQTLLRIGDVVFVPFPYEVFTEITMRLREFSPYLHTLSISCANGSHGYLPDQSQMCRGGYEVEMFKWMTPDRLPEDTDVRIVEENLRLMEKL